jgi:autotransporter-associated beta strand protein
MNLGVGALNGVGMIIRNIGGNSTSILTLGNNNATGGVFSGSIQGASTAANSGLFNSSGIISVTKTGSGTQTLSGTNTYGGATTLNGGTLALGADDVLPNTTAVSIGSATLNAATFTDTVGTLNVTGSAVIHLGSGAALAFAAGSPAWTGMLALSGTFVSGTSLRFGTTLGGLTPTQLARISAPGFVSFALNPTGYLTATAAGAAYASWAATHAPTGTAADDYDGDGVSNGVEYLLGGTKNTNDCGKLPKIAISNSNMLFTFERAQASIHANTNVVIDVGTDLAAWPAANRYAVPNGAAAADPGVSVIKDTPATGKDTVTLSIPRDPDQAKFARLRVTTNG